MQKIVTLPAIINPTIKATFKNSGITATIQFQVHLTPEQAHELMQAFKVPCSVSFSQLQATFMKDTKE